MKSDVRCCARCGKELALEGKPSRGATCPHCGAYLHSCVNCAFYSPGRHNDCREPQAEYVGDKRSSNFCDFFRFREADSRRPGIQTNPGEQTNHGAQTNPGGLSPHGKKKDARDRFDKLFGA